MVSDKIWSPGFIYDKQDLKDEFLQLDYIEYAEFNSNVIFSVLNQKYRFGVSLLQKIKAV